MTTTATTFPTLTPRAVDETAQNFGARALRFLVKTDLYTTVDREALELASHVSTGVVGRSEDQVVLARLHRVRLAMARELTFRRQADAATAAPAPVVSARRTTPPNPVRLKRPVPVRPPAGTARAF